MGQVICDPGIFWRVGLDPRRSVIGGLPTAHKCKDPKPKRAKNTMHNISLFLFFRLTLSLQQHTKFTSTIGLLCC